MRQATCIAGFAVARHIIGAWPEPISGAGAIFKLIKSQLEVFRITGDVTHW